MKNLITIGLFAALCGTAVVASAQGTATKEGMPAMKTMDMQAMGMGMKSMDANGDGVVSKDEFTRHHDAMWGKMQVMDTNGDAMISKDEFTKHHDAMWGEMKKDGNGNVGLSDIRALHDATMMKH